ncbi:hypothetical protein SCHPADRAFT_131389 [Schizopora paradoxa]|uniref:Uncharacterized protein n=1 Tax=Schizopora paradoxa TaxID=27342 RepID=A0A0H2SM30_9AGAM|nr:hypothetical protein SCHPADRAFT_131389 [Schizopora paradoxa]
MSRLRYISVSSLPPEVIEYILIYVVLDLDVPFSDRAWTAVKLSHICRSFRYAALGCPKLWTWLDRQNGRPGLALIEACIERSRSLPLEVVLYFYAYRKSIGWGKTVDMFAVDSIARLLIPVSNRWQRFSANLAFRQYSEQHVLSSSEFTSSSRYLKAPILEKISIQELSNAWTRPPLIDMSSSLPPDWSWNLPALQSLLVQNICLTAIPLKFRNRLQTMKIYFAEGRKDKLLDSLSSFLESTTLPDMEFYFYLCHFEQDYAHKRICRLSHLKQLRVTFSNCSRKESPYCGLRSAFNFYQFSGLVKLSIEIYIGHPGYFPRSITHDMSLAGFLALGIHSSSQSPRFRFPCLETLDLYVSTGNISNSDAPALSFPHSLIPPSLKHLSIESYSISISYDVQGSTEDIFPPPPNLSSAPVSYALQTLTLDIPRLGRIASWVKVLAMKMREQHCWDDFTGLTLRGAPGRDDEQAVHRDDLDRWCEENIGDL